MAVALVLAAAAVVVAVVAVAAGHGGEMARAHPDHAPLDLGPVTAADVALLRPPSTLWGYDIQFTDDALARIARALTERDVQIVALRRQVEELRAAGLTTPTAGTVHSDPPSGSPVARAAETRHPSVQPPRPAAPDAAGRENRDTAPFPTANVDAERPAGAVDSPGPWWEHEPQRARPSGGQPAVRPRQEAGGSGDAARRGEPR